MSLDEANGLLKVVGLCDLSESEIVNFNFLDKSNLKAQSSSNADDYKLDVHYNKSVKAFIIKEFSFANFSTSLISGYFFALTLWWLFMLIFQMKQTPLNTAYGFAFSLVPLIGGVFGLFSLNKQDIENDRHILTSIKFISYGLICWGIGQMSWSFINFVLKIEVPYPSLADLGFIFASPFWGYGFYNLLKSKKIKYLNLSLKYQKILSLIIICFGICNFITLIALTNGKIIATSAPAQLILNFYYTIIDLIIFFTITMNIKEFIHLIKGAYRWPIMILFVAFIIHFIGDNAFAYSTTMGTFYNGSWIDYMFTLSLFLISISVNGFGYLTSKKLYSGYVIPAKTKLNLKNYNNLKSLMINIGYKFTNLKDLFRPFKLYDIIKSYLI